MFTFFQQVLILAIVGISGIGVVSALVLICFLSINIR